MIIATFGTNGNTTPAFCGKAKGIARFSYRIEGPITTEFALFTSAKNPGARQPLACG